MISMFTLLMLFAISVAGWIPMIVTQAYYCLSAVTFILYGLDKLFALKGWRRISEKILHLYGLAGGWPGAHIGQEIFRHKISKPRFQRLYYLTIAINVAVLIGCLKLRG